MAVFTMNMIGVVDLIPPVILRLEDAQGATVTALSIDENSAPGTVVGTVVADASAHTYAIVGGSSTFAISNTGQVTVANNTALDYETTTSLSFQVTASDYANNVSSPISITVNIADVDEIPPTITRTVLHVSEIAENLSTDTLLAEFTASDDGTDVTANITLSANPYNAFYIQHSGGTARLYADSSNVPNVISNESALVTLSVPDAAGNVAAYNQSIKIVDRTSFTGATLVNANSSWSGRDLRNAEQMVTMANGEIHAWEDYSDGYVWILNSSSAIVNSSQPSHQTYSSGQLGYRNAEKDIECVFQLSGSNHLLGITREWVIYRHSGSSWVQIGQVGNWTSSLPDPQRGTFMHNGVLYVQTAQTTSGDWKKVTGVSTSSAGSYQSSAFPGTVLYNSTSLTTYCDDSTVISGVGGYDWLLLHRKTSGTIMVVQLDLGQYLGTVYGVENWSNLQAQASGASRDDFITAIGSYIYTGNYPNEVWRWDASNIQNSEK